MDVFTTSDKANELLHKGSEYLFSLESIKKCLLTRSKFSELDICDRHIYRIEKTISKFEILSDEMIENELENFQHKLNLACDYISKSKID